MGRSAGWLAYGAAIAGEASLVISVEDIVGEYRGEETYTDSETGETKTKPIMKADRLIDRIVKTMVARDRDGKQFGVIVLAEGLAEFLSAEMLKDIPRDEHGHISIAQVNLGKMRAKLVAEAYKKQTGKERKFTGLQRATSRVVPSPRPSTSCSAANWASALTAHLSKSRRTA